MTVIAARFLAAAKPGCSRRPFVGGVLLMPAVIFLSVFLVMPAIVLLAYSIMTPQAGGGMGLPFHIGSYKHLLFDPTYQQVILRTLRIALITSLITVVLAYPLAMTIAYGHPAFGRIVIVLVVMPLLVSVLVRAYGWQILLNNGKAGGINWFLASMGLPNMAVKLLYTEWAVIIASVHVFLPLMVLPIAGALARIDPALNQAARTHGASAWNAFRLVTFPLSLPGLAAGLAIVFSLTASSYITPTMLGGRTGTMLGNLLEQQLTAAYDWSMSGAIAVIMVVISLVVNIGINRIVDRRTHDTSSRGEEGK